MKNNKDLGKNIYDIESSEELIQEINKRMTGLENHIVKEHIENILIPNIKKINVPGYKKDFGLNYIFGLKNDFYRLIENPRDEIANHAYDSFSSNDIKELYRVIYGEYLDV